MNEMIERAAKALYDPWDHQLCSMERCRKLAREVMTAMREPTAAMIAAGLATPDGPPERDFITPEDVVWRAMIDAALE